MLLASDKAIRYGVAPVLRRGSNLISMSIFSMDRRFVRTRFTEYTDISAHDFVIHGDADYATEELERLLNFVP